MTLNRGRRVTDFVTDEFRVGSGRPLPIGVSVSHAGLNFSLFSRHATAVTLVLFAPRQHQSFLELPLDPAVNRTGDLWHIEVRGLRSSVRYGWRADRQPGPCDGLHRFDVSKVHLDPYASALTGASTWGVVAHREGEDGNGEEGRRRSLFLAEEFDWQYVRRPRIALPDKVIYELHVRGFTRHASSGVAYPGTYRGLIEKIPYLKSLGVTTVELLPVYEFDENDNTRFNPVTGERLLNYWGYGPIAFFAPKASYAADGTNGGQVHELKELVRELHRAGLEVILDVVFNHTGPLMPFRGLDNQVYYLVDPSTGVDRDFTGCGNTLRCNHPVVRDLILSALRYWVAEMHIDGFRFDLASILSRGREGEILAVPPVLEQIAADPVLGDTTLIAEAWDAAGLNQVGRFPHWGRWAEWNGAYRDDVRRFLRGDAGKVGALATRLAGSSDLYGSEGRAPGHSVNFVTCHDGFTLADLVSYERKRNEENGEGNRDGTDQNDSWGCGADGPTADRAIRRLREQQSRNFLLVLLLSQGTPMLLAGDEMGRTQNGNNNAYCQDNATSWLDWGLVERNAALHRFTRVLIAFRKRHPVLRRRRFLTGKGDVAWHGTRLGAPDWGPDSRVLAMHLSGTGAVEQDDDVYLAVNGSDTVARFELPAPPPGTWWVRVADTGAAPPGDVAEEGEEPRVTSARLRLRGRSCALLRSRPQL